MNIHIRLGSIGGAVVALQERLVAHGHKTHVTGFADQPTMTAVEAFQEAHGIAERDVVTAETWGALEAEPEAKPEQKKRPRAKEAD